MKRDTEKNIQINDNINFNDRKVAQQEEKLKIEKDKILHHIADAKTDTVIQRVAWILNHYPDTRDSDITCMIKYWSIFEPETYGSDQINVDDLYKLTKLTTIARARAMIQNIHRLFLASPDIRRMRGTLEEDEKEKAIQQKPNYPAYIVYADESGKTENYLIVGSMWILNGFDTLNLYNEIEKWRESSGFKHELHFKRIDKGNIDYYRQVLTILKNMSSALSFKAITLERRGIRNISDAYTQLYYYLLIEGVDHENKTGRCPLPRNLQMWKDADEPGSDKLMLKQIHERMMQAAKVKYDDKLVIDDMTSVDSRKVNLMQLADLFTGSINRTLNIAGDGTSIKDQFAKEFLQEFGLKHSSGTYDGVGDCAFYTCM